MKCTIVKWLISNSLDTHEKLPGFARKHIVSCRECRNFAAVSDEMGLLLSRDAEKINDPSFIYSHAAPPEPFYIFGRAGAAAAFAFCLLIMAAFMSFRHEPQPVDQAISATGDIITDYVGIRQGTAAVTGPIIQFQNEISAIQKDLNAAKQRLIASSHVASEEVISAFLF